VQVVSGPSIENAAVYTPEGKLVLMQKLNNASGYYSIGLPNLQSGMYFLKLSGKGFQKTERIFIK